MTIKEAKEQIKYAVDAYLTKDENDEYIIPVSAQRPVFVMGPPGIGKTDIMKQVAIELGIGLVSYSMTHHTRQSALGLPLIVKKQYNGESYDVSEYTMSEILSTVYDVIEESGMKEGILFLDEINCVSETLAPSMLQFLQFKTFGRHKVPDGWVVVTAGNPPEYNNSVREFDIVTWDRLKRVDVEPNLEVWREYAGAFGVHPAILAYLEIRPQDFYKVETTAEGKRFITARGWVDLSQMMRLFEQKNFPVDKTLVAQYLQNGQTASDFAVYYLMYQQYIKLCNTQQVLDGNYSKKDIKRVSKADFGAKITLVNIFIETILNILKKQKLNESATMSFLKSLREFADISTIEEINDVIIQISSEFERKKLAGALSSNQAKEQKIIIGCYESMIEFYSNEQKEVNISAYMKNYLANSIKSSKVENATIKEQFSNCIKFTTEAFADDQISYLLMSRLTTDPVCADFLAKNPIKEYTKISDKITITDQRQELLKEIDQL